MSKIKVTNLRHESATTDNITLDSSGRVGIGTSSPTVALEVNGGTDNEPIKVVSTDAGSYIAFADNATTVAARLGAIGDDFKIDVNNAERARIDSSGRVGIGQPSPTEKLHVSGSGGTAILVADSSDWAGLSLSGSGSSNFIVSDDRLDFLVNGSTRASILTTGGLTFSGDTAAANALDDYEEGTWTPSTYSNNLSVGSASYVKVGRMCTAHCYLTGVTSWTASTSNPFWIFGFPYQPDGGSGHSAVGSVTLHAIATSQSGTLSAVMDSNNNRCRIQNNPTNSSFDTITLAEMGAQSWTCTVSITYRTTV